MIIKLRTNHSVSIEFLGANRVAVDNAENEKDHGRSQDLREANKLKRKQN